jgi:3-oxoacyl-[acyl-carrier protein] reductase
MKIMIAGASGGIGRFLAEQFDSADNELVLTYNRSKEKVFQAKKAKSIIVECDFTNHKEVGKTFHEISTLDVLINTMGTVENKLVYDMEEEQWDRVVDSNLKTVFLSCKFAAPMMTENGHIINISSVLGTTGMIGATNYCTTKGAVEAFTKSFALECLLKNKIFVNAIALGYFKAGMGLTLSEKIEKMVREKIPLKVFGEPEEISKAINYIISSRYLVGQVIHINGGLRV